MPNYRHLIRHAAITGRPEDAVINTLYSNSADDAAAAAFADRIVTLFGGTVTGQVNNLQEYMGTSISTVAGSHEIRTYDLADPEPRVPVNIRTFGRTAALSGSSNLPRETAICFSFQAVAISGVAQARRRGRIFFGPLNTAATANDATTGDLRPSAAFLADADVALTDFLADTAGLWVVWSETLGQAFDVDNGWIDNALDTIRSRGVAATARTLFT